MNEESITQQQLHFVELPDDREALIQEFIAAGGNPNAKTFQAGELRAREKARADIHHAVERENAARHPASKLAANIILRGVELIAVAFTIVIVLAGMVIGSVLLILAEIAAVQKGFLTIDPVFAPLYAVATVLFFVVVLFIREIIARGASDEPAPVFSLRYAVRWLIYFLGIRRNWTPEYRAKRSLLLRVDSAITWLMYTIVLFGLLGRLSEKVSTLSGNWIDGIEHIIRESSFQDMIGYIGATVMTVALLLSTHFIIFFVHKLYVQVTGGVHMVNFSERSSPELLVEREVNQFYKNEILKLRARNQSSQS